MDGGACIDVAILPSWEVFVDRGFGDATDRERVYDVKITRETLSLEIYGLIFTDFLCNIGDQNPDAWYGEGGSGSRSPDTGCVWSVSVVTHDD